MLVISLADTIYSSRDQGRTWERIDQELPPEKEWQLAFDTDGYLYAATKNERIYRTTKTTLSVHEEVFADNFHLYQSKPNPSSSTVTLRYDVKQRSHLQLTLHDAIGRTIKTVYEGIVHPGSHQVEVDMTDVTSGIYFVGLSDGEYILTEPLVIQH